MPTPRPVDDDIKPPERLVLTAALRVAEPEPAQDTPEPLVLEADDVEARAEPEHSDERHHDADHHLSGEDQDIADAALDEAWDAGYSEAGSQQSSDDEAQAEPEWANASEQHDHASEEMDHPGDAQNLDEEHTALNAVEDHTPEQSQTDEVTGTVEDVPWADPEATLYGAAGLAEEAGASSGVVQDIRPLGEKIAALEEVIARTDDQWEPDDAGSDDYAGTEVETLEWEDSSIDEAEMAEQPAFVVPPVIDDAAAADPEVDDMSEREEAMLDETALRQLVADIVREELQGVLGERITRNVRKLVRREIQQKTVEESSDKTVEGSLDAATEALASQIANVDRVDTFARLLAGAALICAVMAVGYSSWIDRNWGATVAARTLPVETFSAGAAASGGSGLGRDALLLVTMASLEQALETSQPYAYELAVAMKAAQTVDEIARLLDGLTSTAEVGVPTRQELYKAWQKHHASQIDITARMGNVVNRMLNYDPQAKSNIEALLAADELMRAYNLSGALDILTALEGETRYAVLPWLEMAMLRLKVEETVSELRRLTFLSVLSDQV